MLRRVDTVELDPAHADEYVGMLRAEMVPLMEEAGARFEGTMRSAEGLGEPVWVTTTWGCDDYESWNVIRRNLVLDPRWYACAERLHSLRRSGSRRFYRSAP